MKTARRTTFLPGWRAFGNDSSVGVGTHQHVPDPRLAVGRGSEGGLEVRAAPDLQGTAAGLYSLKERVEQQSTVAPIRRRTADQRRPCKHRGRRPRFWNWPLWPTTAWQRRPPVPANALWNWRTRPGRRCVST